MRKSIIVAALAATLVSGAALAAATTDTGAIKSLDAAKSLVTLADGKVFQAPAGWNFANYKVGDKVRVIYEMQNGKMTASEIVRAG
jgi:Cu/Ag efflux protein CusF